MTEKGQERIRRVCYHVTPRRVWDRGSFTDEWLCADCGEALVLVATAKDKPSMATAQEERA